MKHILRILIFIAGLVSLYVACLFVFPQVKVGSTSLMKIATRNPVSPGGFGYALERFREVESYQNVDIVFLGSSHAYRTYDVRIYEEGGYSAFNLGSTGQTPLNSYFLMERYWDRLRPKVVVLDLVYRVIDRDGLECFYDLASNLSYSNEFVQMAIDINSSYAINASLGMWTSSLLGKDAPQGKQEKQDNERYIPGGYVEFEVWDNDSSGTGKINPITVQPMEEQLEYIRKIIDFVREKGSKVVLVTKPEPRENLIVCENYHEVSEQFTRIAEKAGEQFWDFNKIIEPLDWHKHFHDREYLSKPGVEIFNGILLEKLKKNDFLEEGKG